MNSFPIEADIAAVEIRSIMASMIATAIADGRELRAAQPDFPSETIGRRYVELADAADAGVPDEQLQEMMANIIETIAKAMLKKSKEQGNNESN